MLLLAVLLVQESLADLPVPEGAVPPGGWALERQADGLVIPAQVWEGRLHFLDRGRGDSYRALPATAPAAGWTLEEAAGGALVIRHGDREAAVYRSTAVAPPAGLDPVYTRGGFLHPLRSPSGQILTNASPRHHAHHYGVWSGWKRAVLGEREADLWLPAARTGSVEALGIESRSSGPVFAGFRARHRFKIGGRPAIEETWDVKLFAVAGVYVLDLQSIQEVTAAVQISEHRYGGIGFRGPPAWEGKDGMLVRTNEGKAREAAQGSRPDWFVCSGTGGAVGLIGHASNLRAPQSVRVHPDEPFLNWSLPADGAFGLVPGAPLRLRYRFVLADAAPPEALMNALSRSFSSPTPPKRVP